MAKNCFTYIALLRGINIGPHKRMQMERLRACCEALGFAGVKTYIQSGNLIFKAAKLSPAGLAKQLGERIVKDFGFSCEVISRRREEMKKIIEDNPFVKERGLDVSKLHVLFLPGPAAEPAVKKLQQLTLAPDRMHRREREIYFYFPNGVSGSSLWKHPLDRVLSLPVTMRNWKTVTALYQLAMEAE